MNEEMTIEEIESQFESEWVLVEDPRTDETLKVLGGRVLYHSKDRDEVYRKAVSLRPKRSAIVYTGQIPEETAVVLRATQDVNVDDFPRPRFPERQGVGVDFLLSAAYTQDDRALNGAIGKGQ